MDDVNGIELFNWIESIKDHMKKQNLALNVVTITCNKHWIEATWFNQTWRLTINEEKKEG